MRFDTNLVVVAFSVGSVQGGVGDAGNATSIVGIVSVTATVDRDALAVAEVSARLTVAVALDNDATSTLEEVSGRSFTGGAISACLVIVTTESIHLDASIAFEDIAILAGGLGDLLSVEN